MLCAFLERAIFQATSNDAFIVYYNETVNVLDGQSKRIRFILFWCSFQNCNGLFINVE